MFSSADLDERAPLLQFQFPSQSGGHGFESLPDAYKQFCHLVGNQPVDYPPGQRFQPPKDSLYRRAIEHRKTQGRMYIFTSTLVNTLLLSQIVLGAALTGLGASRSSPVLVTIFGALNTVIAGLVAFLKSRGQPMRARMFRDDLDRVVDEIENSAIMWQGISQKIHGYDAIDTDESVTVRSEVARLTRLYDRAVRTNTMNDPDFYGAGISSDHVNAGLRSRTGQPLLANVPQNMPPTVDATGSAPADPVTGPAPAADPDESPATKAPAPPPKNDADSPLASDGTNGADCEHKKEDKTQPFSSVPPSSSVAAPIPVTADPDSSPATAPLPAKSKAQKDPA